MKNGTPIRRSWQLAAQKRLKDSSDQHPRWAELVKVHDAWVVCYDDPCAVTTLVAQVPADLVPSPGASQRKLDALLRQMLDTLGVQ